MQAARFAQFGPPRSVLRVMEAPNPQARGDELLIRVKASAVNPSDVKIVLGRMSQTTLPRTPGRDFAGVVERGPANWVGKEVWGSGNLGVQRDGAHAEYLVLSATDVRLKPPMLSFEQAASVGVSFIAAWLGLNTAGQLKRGETLLVIGTGAVGSAAVQLGKAIGARIITADRRDPDPGLVRRGLIDRALNTATGPVPQVILDDTAGHGADVVMDTVGGVMFESALKCIAHGGRLVEISSVGMTRVSFELPQFYHREGQIIGVDTLQRSPRQCAQILDSLVDGFACGDLAPPSIGKTYPLKDVVGAYEQVEEGLGDGKVVLTP